MRYLKLINKAEGQYEIDGKRLIFTNHIPDKFDGIVIDYENPQNGKVNNYINLDIRNTIVLHQKKWLKELEVWHQKISDHLNDISYIWPLFHGSRLVFWKTVSNFEFRNIFFSAGLMECIKSESAPAFIVRNCPKEVFDIFESSSFNQGSKPAKYKFSQIKSELFFFISLIKDVLKSIKNVTFKNNLKKLHNVKTIIFSYNLFDDSKINNDHFFGIIKDGIDSRLYDELLFLYDFNFINQLGTKYKNRISLDSFISIKLVIKSIYTLLIERRKIIKALKNIENINLNNKTYPTVTNEFIENLIIKPSSLFSVMANKIAKKILQKVNAKHIVYPFEEKTVERAILMAINELNLGIRSTGFAHAAYSDGHLYTIKNKSKKHIPSRIAVTGPLQYKKFLELGWPSSELEIVGSPRYKGVHDLKMVSNEILVLIGYDFELVNFYRWINEVPELMRHFNISIRNHPNIRDKNISILEKKLKIRGIKILDSSKSLMDTFKNATIILYESTSSAIEASLSGKYLIKIRISDSIDANHFNNENSLIPHCKTPLELYKTLLLIKKMDDNKIKNLIHEQQKIMKNYYIPMNYTKLII